MQAKVPKKISDRIKTEIKKYQKILADAKVRDINESDTVIIISDILSDVLGFDKYSEITTEFAIRGTYVDLAIKIDGEIFYLVEAKAIGLDLKENHLKQAVDYAANQGIDWIVLTNGEIWQVYKVLFKKPIDVEKAFEFNLIDFTPRDTETIYELYTLTREGVKKSAIADLHEKGKITNKFAIAAILQTESVLKAIVREIKNVNKSIKVDTEYVASVIEKEIIKREVREGDGAEKAKQLIKKSQAKAAKKRKTIKKSAGDDSSPEPSKNLPVPATLIEETKPNLEE